MVVMLTVIAGIIEREGTILIAQRKRSDQLAHKWEFPGGKLEAGETPEQCLVRELREEFGIDTEVTGFVGASIHAYDHISINLLAYATTYQSGEFVLNDHEAIRWVSIAELTDYDFAEADRPIVRQLQERRDTSSEAADDETTR